DPDKVRDALARLSPPLGGIDWPAAVQTAHDVLKTSHRPRRDIIILSDGQKFGWADEYALHRWRLLASQRDNETNETPHLWFVNLDPGRPASPPNWSLAPLRTGRAAASTTLGMETALRVHGQAYAPPHRLRLEIDGQAAPDLTAPAANDLRDGQ